MPNDRMINSTKQGPSREAGSGSVGKEIYRLLWNPKVHCRTHKSPPLDPIVIVPSQFNAVP
jgi:hypothetical protein